jgi:trehalose utilization protein
MHERASHEPLRVTVWGENVHEPREEDVRAIYPDGMHATIAAGLVSLLGDAVRTRTVTLQDPEHGLTEEVLRETTS